MAGVGGQVRHGFGYHWHISYLSITMRPVLSLKKRPPAPPAVPVPEPQAMPVPAPKAVVKVVAEPAAETVKPTKASKPPKLTAKQIQAAANRQLDEAWCAQRQRLSQTLPPFIQGFLAQQHVLRDTVVVDGVTCFKPLALRIHKQLLPLLRTCPETEGCSMQLLTELFKAAMNVHTHSESYLNGMLKFDTRFDLDGNPTGPLSDAHKRHAAKRLAKLQPTG